MIKTTYQTPEIRNANDEIVQEGAFGKNTALSNATNDGWIDYVVNNLEALHDTIGDSAATLDGNGHVVEPANLAIGDEDGNRLKTSYLKLTGGTVAGTLNVQQNLKFQDNQENVFGGVYVPSSSATEQYAQFYGGEGTGVAGAKLTLYPDGDGRFKLEARSTDGANTYTLVTDNNGNLNWRGYPLAWKKDYLPLAGGTMTGNIRSGSNEMFVLRKNDNLHGIQLWSGTGYNDGASISLYGKGASQSGVFNIGAYGENASYLLHGEPNGILTWGGNSIALAKDYLPLAGGAMTGAILRAGDVSFATSNEAFTRYCGGSSYTTGASLQMWGGEHQDNPGKFSLMARSIDGTISFVGSPNGILTWGGKNIERVESSGTNYIRYASGLQICWGTMSVPGAAVNDETITFPMPFKDGSSYNITVGRFWAYSKDENYHIKSTSGTGFTWATIGTVSTNSHGYRYIAIGFWK